MSTVCLATHCHARDLPRLHASGVLEELVSCHDYPFDEILVIHQRTDDLIYTLPNDARIQVIDIREFQYPMILGAFAIPHKDPVLSELTHGWNWQWYYEHHCVNHCKEILSAKSDYIVFNDADCRIINQEGSWIIKAIELMEKHSDIFVVSPSDGGHEFIKVLEDGTRLTQTMSQQLFIGKRSNLTEMEFLNLPWDGQFRAPFGPMQEFYGMMEGHIWRWMDKHGLYRAILPEQWRYWHNEWH